jgi:hypothetical protein
MDPGVSPSRTPLATHRSDDVRDDRRLGESVKWLPMEQRHVCYWDAPVDSPEREAGHERVATTKSRRTGPTWGVPSASNAVLGS